MWEELKTTWNQKLPGARVTKAKLTGVGIIVIHWVNRKYIFGVHSLYEGYTVKKSIVEISQYVRLFEMKA